MNTSFSYHNVSGQNGFTLVEILVYLALLVTLATVMVWSLLQLKEPIQRYQVDRTLYATANNILSRLHDDIRVGSAISGISVLNTDPGTLVIDTTNDSITYSVDGAELQRSSNGKTDTLLPETVAVDSFIVSTLSSSKTDAVRVVLQLTAANGVATSTERFYVTTVLRGTYE